ncbi:unnamed protein product, partial [Musa banksii]
GTFPADNPTCISNNDRQKKRKITSTVTHSAYGANLLRNTWRRREGNTVHYLGHDLMPSSNSRASGGFLSTVMASDPVASISIAACFEELVAMDVRESGEGRGRRRRRRRREGGGYLFESARV